MNLNYNAPVRKIMFICIHCWTVFNTASYTTTKNHLAIGTCPHCWQETFTKL